MFGSLYKYDSDENRFIFVKSGHSFPDKLYTKRYWALVSNKIALQIEEGALQRGRFLELRKDPRKPDIFGPPTLARAEALSAFRW